MLDKVYVLTVQVDATCDGGCLYHDHICRVSARSGELVARKHRMDEAMQTARRVWQGIRDKDGSVLDFACWHRDDPDDLKKVFGPIWIWYELLEAVPEYRDVELIIEEWELV